MRKTYYILTMIISMLITFLFIVVAFTSLNEGMTALISLVIALCGAGFFGLSLLGLKNDHSVKGIIIKKTGIFLMVFSVIVLLAGISAPDKIYQAILLLIPFLIAGIFVFKKGMSVTKKYEEYKETLLRNEEWKTYTEKLITKLPHLKGTLRDGASIDNIKYIEAQAGVAFPKELKSLYLTNDGDDNSAVCGMLLGFHFLSLENMFNEWQRSYPDTKWLPIGTDGGGNFLGVDLTIDENKSYGNVIFYGRDEQDKTVLSRNLTVLFERFSRIVDSKDFYIGEYDNEKVILLGTDDIEEGSYLIDYLKLSRSVK